jgi:methionyl-tRNA formyltransferase
MPLTIVFMGTPDFAAPALDALVAAGHRVRAVYSQPPRKAGRGMAEAKSPVHRRAEALGLSVRTPVNFKGDADRADFIALGADAAVVVAYGLILPEAILTAPRFGCFNVHASKLPRWRGAAPIQRAIMAGDQSTAVAIMKMEKGLDTGPVCLSRDVTIRPDMNAGALHDALATAGAELMVEALALLEAGRLSATPQPETGVTYAAKIDKAESRIDFSRPAADVVNHVRGLSPSPGAWFQAPAPGGELERIKALRAEAVDGAGPAGAVLDDQLTVGCGHGAVRMLQVQRAGKTAVSAAEFLRGFPLAKGARVG